MSLNPGSSNSLSYGSIMLILRLVPCLPELLVENAIV